MKGLTFQSITVSLCIFFLTGCVDGEKREPSLFESMDPAVTGIDFENSLAYDQEFNIYTYRNFYNGGGVAIGDINNDGLPDIYFTANQGSNKLYLNKGNFRFEDITVAARVEGTRRWSTGVSMADVNGDGWLDIYVCNSGDISGDDKQNELFINNGDLTFSERGHTYGVDDKGFTTHAVFFDFDNDGDLDLYVLNNSYLSIGNFNLRKNERPVHDKLGGDKLLRNDNGTFIDVTAEAGVYGSVIGFGLGVTVGDVNKDGWMDIYVSNDFFERDYLYINQKNGTFKEQLTRSIKSISAASMGADLADINNDTWPDIFVTDMLPESNERIKSVTTFQNWDNYQYNVENDYYHQFTRNSFQLNDRDTTFSEIGRLLGIQATDWSWGALMFDMNNDGRRDIFVANGIYKDLTDQDYLQHISNADILKTTLAQGQPDYRRMIDAIPSNKIANNAFENLGEFQFENKAHEWGLDVPGFSNGAAYGDLDNDGDLDLVVNNVNMTAFVYKNNSTEHLSRNFLKLTLAGEGGNTSAIGASITCVSDSFSIYVEQMPMRGFQSSVDPRPNIGLGQVDTLSEVRVRWPSGKTTTLRNIAANQLLFLKESDAEPAPAEVYSPSGEAKFMLSDVSRLIGLNYQHVENGFVDFDRDRLIFHMLSTAGPRVCVGDINGDGLDDLYSGGSKDHPGIMLRQNRGGGFEKVNEKLWQEEKQYEDSESLFFDADGDGDLDLYIGSGGNEFEPGSAELRDRLYLNDGAGNFARSLQSLPQSVNGSTSCVKSADFDGDGDMDLFVGIRMEPGRYGIPVSGYLFRNNGQGAFEDVTAALAPGLKEVGHITDAIWTDIDADGLSDLVVVGEWMPVMIFKQEDGKFRDVTNLSQGGNSTGWWNRVVAGDIDHDGDVDLVVGNHGLNSRFKATAEKPLTMYTGDFDQSGNVEQIICMYYGDKSYPAVLRHDLVSQLQGLKKKYLKHENYKNETITDIFTRDELGRAVYLEAKELRSMVMLNDGNGTFEMKPLPVEAQFSPMYGLLLDDVTGDGNVDLLMGGNLYGVKPEAGRYDASHGLLLAGDGKGSFKAMPQPSSGINLDGEVRDIVKITIGGQPHFLVARNNDTPLVLRKN